MQKCLQHCLAHKAIPVSFLSSPLNKDAALLQTRKSTQMETANPITGRCRMDGLMHGWEDRWMLPMVYVGACVCYTVSNQSSAFQLWVLDMKYLSRCFSEDSSELSINLRPLVTESIPHFLTTRIWQMKT